MTRTIVVFVRNSGIVNRKKELQSTFRYSTFIDRSNFMPRDQFRRHVRAWVNAIEYRSVTEPDSAAMAEEKNADRSSIEIKQMLRKLHPDRGNHKDRIRRLNRFRTYVSVTGVCPQASLSIQAANSPFSRSVVAFLNSTMMIFLSSFLDLQHLLHT